MVLQKIDREVARKAVTMTSRRKVLSGSSNLFRDLGFREPEAQNLALRSGLMIQIEESVKRSGMTQARIAARLGLTVPQRNALLKGKIERFTLEALVIVATRLGMKVRLLVTTAGRTVERSVATGSTPKR